ncbi:TrmB family transcriptional regulator [Patescibacteria group bacterium]
MSLLPQLQQIGLNQKEAKIYLANLELGEASIQEIAKKSGIKRTSIYNLIDDLVKRGVIHVVIKKNKKRFVAAEPGTLKEIIAQRKKALENILPDLKMLSGTTKEKPRVRFYEGLEGIKAVYNDTLIDKKSIKAFTGVTKGFAVLGKYGNEYIAKRAATKIKAQVITPNDAEGRMFKKKDRISQRITRLIPKKKFPFDIEINIYGNKVSFISYSKQRLMGVIMESPEIAKTMESIFDLSWEYAGLIGKKRKNK